jgi:cytochrome c553
MKTIFRAFLVVLAIAFTLSTRTSAAAAAADYKAKCASCHGAEGKGETAMAKAMKIKDLASDDVQKQSDADLTGIIAKARNPCPPTKAS